MTNYSAANKPVTLGIFSDLHGNYERVLGLGNGGKNSWYEHVDAWISCGDFFPDIAWYGSPYEAKGQMEWWNKNRNRFIELLGGKPLLSVDGNHDAISLHEQLKHRIPNTFKIDHNTLCNIHGLTFAGFGATNLDASPNALREYSEKACNLEPTILVTHSPSSTVLCHNKPEWGVQALEEEIHKHLPIRYHLHGHVHEDGGKQHKHPGTGLTVINTACRLMIIQVQP